MKAEYIKCIRQHELCGFGAVTLSPKLLHTNRDIEFGGPMHTVHLAEEGHTNGLQAPPLVEQEPQLIGTVSDALKARRDHLLRDRMRLLAVVDRDGKVVCPVQIERKEAFTVEWAECNTFTDKIEQG